MNKSNSNQYVKIDCIFCNSQKIVIIFEEFFSKGGVTTETLESCKHKYIYLQGYIA